MNCAVIVDSRPIKKEIVEAHMKHLHGWDLAIFIQPNSLNVAKELNAKAYVCPLITSLNQYNQYLTSESFWGNLVEYDKVLIFQQDSMLLRDGIEEFFEWDYLGAPWKWQSEPKFGGNGGLSLRSPKLCLSLVQNYKWSNSMGYEDVYFTNNLHQVGGKVAPYEVCKRFSCEAMFELGTLGYHAIEKYLTKSQVEQIKNQYK